MDYVTSVELFIDLKPRICEVCILYTHKNFVGCDKLPGIIYVYSTSLQLVNFFAQYARTKLFRSITTYIISLTSTTYIFDQDKIF